jgi:hypothetical protein
MTRLTSTAPVGAHRRLGNIHRPLFFCCAHFFPVAFKLTVRHLIIFSRTERLTSLINRGIMFLAACTTGLLLVASLSSASVVHAQSQSSSSCFRNTTEILVQQTLEATTAADERKVYTLCPNTVFELGPSTVPGKLSPLVARSNTLFQCGADGSSANNCVLSGGESQFWSTDTVFDNDGDESSAATTNVVVQGITFQDAQHVAILLETAGDVTFIDCIIRVSTTHEEKIDLLLTVEVCFSHAPIPFFSTDRTK